MKNKIVELLSNARIAQQRLCGQTDTHTLAIRVSTRLLLGSTFVNCDLTTKLSAGVVRKRLGLCVNDVELNK